ncbi:MAG: hypothetical protein ICV78_11560 [Tolypothrix sp. Co-bin9]|jgi:ubiquinone biosynthesis protein Coq4|nr:hypothetical protein [Tolypothrix sp. Co-bin9]
MLLEKRRQFYLDLLSTLKGTITLFRDASKTDSVYDIEDGLRHSKASILAVKFVKSQPEVAQLIQERYIAPPPDIDALLKYPEGSLGHTYASYIKNLGFDPNFYRKIQVEDDISYILLRLRQTHDIWHLVTGFDPDEIGEIALKAFEIAQTRRTLSAMLLAGGLIRVLLKEPEQLDILLDRIAVGYRMGSKAKPLLAQKWEEHWDKPLSEWRSELGVEPMPVYIP